jgi:hypothetical protein
MPLVLRDRQRDGSTQQPRSISVLMDLGFRSNPNMHRAHCGSSRVRIEARQTVGGANQDFWKSGLEPISTWLFVTERNEAGCKKNERKNYLRMAATSALTFTTFS